MSKHIKHVCPFYLLCSDLPPPTSSTDGVSVPELNAQFSQALRDIYSCPFSQLWEKAPFTMRKANGTTRGYPLPPPLNPPHPKKHIHLQPQFRVTGSETEADVCKSFCPLSAQLRHASCIIIIRDLNIINVSHSKPPAELYPALLP